MNVRLAAGLAFLALLPFLPALRHGFVFDDNTYITANPMVRAGLTVEGLRWALTSLHAGHWHPVTWISHMIDVELFGMNPAGHHAVNLLLHAANVALLFLLLERATRSRGRAAAVAAFFAVHPLHVESVAWVSDRKDLLAAGFSLLAMLAWTRWARRRRAADYAAAFAAYLFALESKSMSVVLPAMLLVLDAWPLRRFAAGGAPRGRLVAVIDKAPFLAAGLVVSLLTTRASNAVSGGLTPDPWPLGTQLAGAMVQYARYAVNVVYPHRLAILHPIVTRHDPSLVALSALFLAVLTAAAALLRARAPYLAAGWAWFLLTLVPVMGLVPSGPMSPADRYMYLPLAGPLVMIAWGAADLAGVTGRVARDRRRLARTGTATMRRAPAAIAALATIALGLASVRQVSYWRDPATLFERARAIHPDNPQAWQQLALVAGEAGDDARAEELERRALAIDSTFVDARYGLALLLAHRGRLEEAEAHLRVAVRVKPRSVMVWYALGQVLADQGRADEAASCIARARALEAAR